MSHDKAACPLCRRLAAGQTHLMNGNVEISPLCEACQKHHYERFPCSAVVNLDKRICPRCRVNRRALVDIPQSGRWVHKTYAVLCNQCFMIEGWHQITRVVHLQDGDREVSWYEKPAVKDDLTGEQLIEMAGRSVASKRSSR